MALLVVTLMAPLAIRAQEVEVLYDFRYSTPVEYLVHKDVVFSRYENGQLAVREASNENWKRVGLEIPGFIERMVQTETDIWLFTSDGSVYGSSDAGETWSAAPGKFRCLGEGSGGKVVGIVDDRIELLAIEQGRILTSPVETRVPVLHTAVEIAMKGDTVLLCLKDRLTVVTILVDRVLSIAKYEGPIQRFSFGGSNSLHMLGYYFYRQASSLTDDFQSTQTLLRLQFYTSVSTGTSANSRFFLVSGKEPRGFGYASVVRQYWPDSSSDTGGLQYTTLDIGDSLGTIVAATVVGTRTYASNWVGTTFVRTDDTWLNFDDRYRRIGTRGVWNVTQHNGQLRITQGINSLNRARPPVFREFTRDGVTEPLASNPELLDSIESVLGYFPSATGRKLIVGSQGWIATEPDDAFYTLGGRRDFYSVHQFDNGELLTSHGFRGMALSSDTGRTWTRAAHRPIIHGGYIAPYRNDSLYVLSSVNGRWVFLRHQNHDTLVVKSLPSAISSGFTVIKSGGLHFEVVGTYTDTLGRTYVRFENYLYDSLIASHNVFVGGKEMLGPIVYSNADTVKLFFHYTMELLTFVGRELLSRRSYMTRVTEQFQYASQNNVFWLSSDSIRILRPSEGVAITIVLRDSVVSSVDQGIWHFYLENVHPNPATNTVTVDVGKFLTADRSSVQLQLWTLDGTMIQDYTPSLPTFGLGNEKHTVHLNVSDIPSGMYLLVIKNSQITRSEKIIIRR